VSGNLFEAIERMALILAAVLIAAGALMLAPHTAYSLTIGAALAAVNAVLIHRIGKKLQGRSPSFVVVIFQAKLFLIIGLIYVAMRYLGVEAVPFAIGISVLPVAVLTAGFFRKQLVASSTEGSEANG
jgi:hypothetical protein